MSSLLHPLVLTFGIGSLAAILFVIAALGPVTPRQRAGIAILGIIIDWIPVVAGWMTVEGIPPRLLLAAHFGFGGLGYVLLFYCLLGWIHNHERPMAVRVSFVAIWGVAYLAGVLMIINSLLF